MESVEELFRALVEFVQHLHEPYGRRELSIRGLNGYVLRFDQEQA